MTSDDSLNDQYINAINNPLSGVDLHTFVLLFSYRLLILSLTAPYYEILVYIVLLRPWTKFGAFVFYMCRNLSASISKHKSPNKGIGTSKKHSFSAYSRLASCPNFHTLAT